MISFKKMNKDTRTEIIGLFFILICFWLLFYFIPEIFASLFHTFLGKCILILFVIIVCSYHLKYGIILACIFIIIYRFSLLREGFTSESKNTFLMKQSTMNPNIIFDIDLIEKYQASQEELDYFNKNGLWPWSDETKDLFIQAINANPFVKIAPDGALLDAQNIYNEAAILRLLSYQTKEGQALLNGIKISNENGNEKEELPSGFGEFPYKSGLKKDLRKDIIRCNNGSLERIHYDGTEGIYGSQLSITTPVNYNDLQNIIPGFTFVKGPCNPCGAIQENPDYQCPFELKLGEKDTGISNVWKTLWKI
jgi:hypothetical protein